MIKVNEIKTTDFRAIEDRTSRLGTIKEMDRFFDTFISDYQRLNDGFCFSQSFNREFVFEQIRQKWAIRNRELFGIPFGVKDIFNTKVLPTEMGSDIWKGFMAGNNARVVDEVDDAGGIIFSKTTTAEFAVHYIQAGRTINPHNRDRITGTSSAGSAVAVATGALPICLGTQTAGSIIRPASFCGVYGFKPSFGAYDRTGMLKTTDTLDTVGLLGSDIYGLRKTFLATFQKDPQYPQAQNYFLKQSEYRQKRRLRVGVVAEQFRGYGRYDDYVKADFEKALSKLSALDVDFVPVEGADFINDIHALQDRIYCKSLAYYFKAEAKRGSEMSEVMSQMVALGNQISVESYIDALERQPEYRARFNPIMNSFDFILTPSTASVAPAIGKRDCNLGRQEEREDTCLIWTFFGYPVLGIPAFWSEAHKMPFGLQVVAPKFCDIPLFGFGEEIVECLR